MLCLCTTTSCTLSLLPTTTTPFMFAGKYVPSISHYIVQAAAMADGTVSKLHKVRALPPDVEPPVFKLGGLAIGNGFTEAVQQTRVQVRHRQTSTEGQSIHTQCVTRVGVDVGFLCVCCPHQHTDARCQLLPTSFSPSSSTPISTCLPTYTHTVRVTTLICTHIHTHTHTHSHTHPQAEVAFNLGLIDTRQRREAEAIQEEVVDLVLNRQWVAARKRSDELLAYIIKASHSATLEDIRRDKAYDDEDRVSTYLNRPGVCGVVLKCVAMCWIGQREEGVGHKEHPMDCWVHCT